MIRVKSFTVRGNGATKRRLTATATVLATAALLLPAGSAQAVGGFHTSFSSVRVRAGASASTVQVGTITPAGTAIDIACQVMGQSVAAVGGVSAVWDKLNGYGGGYISDLFVNETAYARLDSRIPQCGVASAPAPTASTREAKALAWATGQLGRYTDDYGRPTSGWCGRWSVGAYGRLNAGYNAWPLYLSFKALGLTHTGTAPAGAFVFFAPTSVNGYAGHVAIADGGGMMITTTGSNVQRRPLSYAGAPYAGWSWAPAGWSR